MKIYISSKINIVQTYLLFVLLTFAEKVILNYKSLFKQLKLILQNFFPKKIS